METEPGQSPPSSTTSASGAFCTTRRSPLRALCLGVALATGGDDVPVPVPEPPAPLVRPVTEEFEPGLHP